MAVRIARCRSRDQQRGQGRVVCSELLRNGKSFTMSTPSGFGEQHLLLHGDVPEQASAKLPVRVAIDDGRVRNRTAKERVQPRVIVSEKRVDGAWQVRSSASGRFESQTDVLTDEQRRRVHDLLLDDRVVHQPSSEIRRLGMLLLHRR